MLAFTVLAWPAAAQSPEARESKVQLAWSPDFTPTGMVVAEKETLSIAIEPILPDAQERGVFIRERLAAIGGLDSFVGRIGDGEPFKVGREYKQVVTSGGPLSLRWDIPPVYAQFVRGFTATIRVEPAPVVDFEDPDKNTIVTDGNGIVTDGNGIVTDGNVTADGNETAAGPDTTNVQTAIVNESVDGPIDNGGGSSGGGGSAGGQGGGMLASALPWLAGVAVLLIAAAASVSLRRVQRRRTLERTRSMLSVSPSLDLAEGACRGGSLPAEGPSASLRARLEEGAMRCVEGGEDG